TPEEQQVLKGLSWAPFRPSSDLQLVPIRQLSLFKQTQTIKANEGLSPTDKATKTAALQAQMDDLDRLSSALNAMNSLKTATQ
ncbi:MAG: phosphonate ABC transporter substrate-binding protein, partial [Enterobacterales bacterium]|nr:phosphonate ABC transporter substrate-binding protein [Enterobacterales bacterium]